MILILNRIKMSEKAIYKFTETLKSELGLAVILGFPLCFCAIGLY